MNLTLPELETVALELEACLVGGQIQAIRQPSHSALWLGVRGPGKSYGLLLETAHRAARMHLVDGRSDTLTPPPRFVAGLRAHLENARLVAVDLPWPDRVVVLRCQRGSERRALIFECSSHHPNLFLADWDGTIELALNGPSSHRRSLLPGHRYEPPPAAPARAGVTNRVANVDAPSRHLEQLYLAEEAQLALAEARQRRAQALRSHEKRLVRASTKVTRDLERLAQWPDSQRRGELLKANYHQLAPGASEVTVVDYFDPDQPSLTLALDPALTVQANVDAAFARARKGKRGERLARERLDALSKQIAAARAALERVEAASDRAELEAMDRELVATFPSLRRLLDSSPQERRRAGRPRRLPYRTFLASTGRRVLVGRKGKDNHELTFQVASPHDIWLHVRGFPGSHVVIPLARNQEPDDRTLLEAGLLAVHFSKAPDSGLNEVMWCRKKHVRAMKKGAPGQVIVEQEKNLPVAWDEETLRGLLARREEA